MNAYANAIRGMRRSLVEVTRNLQDEVIVIVEVLEALKNTLSFIEKSFTVSFFAKVGGLKGLSSQVKLHIYRINTNTRDAVENSLFGYRYFESKVAEAIETGNEQGQAEFTVNLVERSAELVNRFNFLENSAQFINKSIESGICNFVLEGETIH